MRGWTAGGLTDRATERVCVCVCGKYGGTVYGLPEGRYNRRAGVLVAHWLAVGLPLSLVECSVAADEYLEVFDANKTELSSSTC